MAGHVIRNGPWPAGATVTAYKRRIDRSLESSQPPGQAPVASTTADSGAVVTFGDVLDPGEKYWAVGQDSAGVWRWVNFTTGRLGLVRQDFDPVVNANPVTSGYADGQAPGWDQGREQWLPQSPALKAPTTADAFGTQIMYVAQKNGSDSADGLSRGTPKKTLEAAVAATPNGALIRVVPGSYTPTVTLALNGHWIEADVRGSGGTNAAVTINHAFDGDAVSFAKGGGLRNIFFNQTGNFTGAAIHAVSTGAPRGGSIWLENVTVSGSQGFERDLVLDGSADSTVGGPGIRQVFVKDSMFFGCKTAGETVVVNRGVHVYFTACEVIAAPEAGVTQGIKVLDAITEAVQFIGCYVLGDFSTEAAGTGVIFSGHVTGTVTFAAGSARNVFTGICGSGIVNNGAASNLAYYRTSTGELLVNNNVVSAADVRAHDGGAAQVRLAAVNGGKPGIAFGPSSDAYLQQIGPDILASGVGDKFVATGGLGAGGHSAATTPGSVVRKLPLYDTDGTSIVGYIPVYNSIS